MYHSNLEVCTVCSRRKYDFTPTLKLDQGHNCEENHNLNMIRFRPQIINQLRSYQVLSCVDILVFLIVTLLISNLN